jgi:hypothetical protein
MGTLPLEVHSQQSVNAAQISQLIFTTEWTIGWYELFKQGVE